MTQSDTQSDTQSVSLSVDPPPHWRRAGLPLLYVVAVLLADSLAVQQVHWPIEWSQLVVALGGFNVVRFVFWLVIPLLWSARDLDLAYYGFGRWTRGDVLLSLALVGAGVLLVLLVPKLPGVAEYYRPRRFLSDAARWRAWRQVMLWNLAWLPGWEFMLRYVLLRRLSVVRPVAAVAIVAVIEGAYHLPKPPLEVVAMVLFSVFASTWAVKRRNGLLPLLVHGAVECALAVYLVL